MLRVFSAVGLLLALLATAAAFDPPASAPGRINKSGSAPRQVVCQARNFQFYPCNYLQCTYQRPLTIPPYIRPDPGLCYCHTVAEMGGATLDGFVSRRDLTQPLADPKTGLVLSWQKGASCHSKPCPKPAQQTSEFIGEVATACVFGMIFNPGTILGGMPPPQPPPKAPN